MLSLSELHSLWRDLTRVMDDEIRKRIEVCESRNSSPTSVPASSLTPTAECGGDGSALQTTGPTQGQWNEFIRRVFGLWTDAGYAMVAWDNVRSVLEQARSFLGSADCANGGHESPLLRSDAQPDNSRGESCAATPTAEHSVLIPIRRLTDLSERLHSEAALLSGIVEPFYNQMRMHQEREAREALAALRMYADQLLGLT